MRRLFMLALALLVLPAAAEAQPRIMLGGGFTAPNGSISDVVEPGYHLQAGLQVGIPTLPVAIRADGALHRMGSADAAFSQTDYLTGALSLVFMLPGVGLQPYFLGGVGSYRSDSGPIDMEQTVVDSGYHGGFGVVLGGLGFGAFAEIRYIQINSDLSKTRLIPLTLGFRL